MEGQYTGVPTVWVRWWGCNLTCAGFGQRDLDNPSTWELPYQTFNIDQIKHVDELPVWHTGCDSSYSWAKRFSHLAPMDTADDIAAKLTDLMRNSHNPNGLFQHPGSGQETHLAFTGGEPMMSYKACVDTMLALHRQGNMPRFVTVETNGTQRIRQEMVDLITAFQTTSEYGGLVNDERGPTEWFWSVSPKLRASGERWEDTIKPEVLTEYARVSDVGQLKYVVDGSDRTWDEVERATALYRQAGVCWPVWIMPVGADLEMQEEVAASIAEDAIDRGYNVSARVHVYLFGNVIGK